MSYIGNLEEIISQIEEDLNDKPNVTYFIPEVFSESDIELAVGGLENKHKDFYNNLRPTEQTDVLSEVLYDIHDNYNTNDGLNWDDVVRYTTKQLDHGIEMKGNKEGDLS